MTRPATGRSVRSAIVIGAGHNGLVCAALLARAGVKVTVLEAAEQVGGAAVTREFAPGYRVSAGAHLLYGLDEDLCRELALERYGLRMAAENLYTIALDPDGAWQSFADGALGGPGARDEDRPAMARYHRDMQRFAAVLRSLANRIPPRLGTRSPADLLTLGRLAVRLRALGRDDLREFLRIAGINIHDVLEERFASERLKGALALDGVLGAFLGPRSNNSVFCALQRYSGGRGYALPAGGMGTVSVALDGAARAAGASVRTGARVAGLRVDGGAVRGVTLEGGESLEAEAVISNADPRTTFRDLLGLRHLEAGFADRVAHLRTRGCVARLHLALDGPPPFIGLDGLQRGQRLVIAPGLDAVEQAFNAAKYGEASEAPVMELTLPTVHDDTLAPPGKHVLSANVQWAPRDLKGGWKAGRNAFLERCMAVLEAHAPGIGDRVTARELLTPEDLETEFGMSGGHWHHVELALDRFFMLRPVPGAARYAAPVPGLWLCGAGCHPGGGVTGRPGRNAAKAVLRGGDTR